MRVRTRRAGVAQLALPLPARRRREMPIVISYGGGLDSWVMLVEAVRRGIRVAAVVFADVRDPDAKDPGEWPQTYEHLRTVVIPFCEKHGIPFVWLDKRRYTVRGALSLFAWMWARGQIPVAGPDRICTRIAKVGPFEAWMHDTFPGQTVEVWVGFEAGEEGRAEKDPNRGNEYTQPKPVGSSAVVRLNLVQKPGRRRNRFPLIEWRLCRCRALKVAQGQGLPVPPGSACVYCPFGTRGDWQRFSRDDPEGFARVVELEARKGPTKKNGLKLSIMGYDSKKKNAMVARGEKYVPPTLPQWIAGEYRPRLEPCEVCGAPQKLKKNVGCGFAQAA